MIENFYSDLPTFSRLENHSTKCGSDLQTFKHRVLENLGLRISGISRRQAPSMLVSSIHTICGYIIAAGQINQTIPAISNWNFWFCRFNSVWLQTEFFEVNHSFDFWLRARRRHRFDGGHFAKSDDQKIKLDFIAYSVVIKVIPTWRHELF